MSRLARFLAAFILVFAALGAGAQVSRLQHPDLSAYVFAGSGATSSPVALKLVDSSGRLIVGGPFTEVNGLPRNGVVRINASDSTIDTTWNPSIPAGGVSVAFEEASGSLLLVVATVIAPSKIANYHLYRVDAVSGAGTLLYSVPGVYTISAIAADPQGRIYIAEHEPGFVPTSDRPAYVRRLTAAGIPDSSYVVTITGRVACLVAFSHSHIYALAHDGAGRLFIGGDFTAASATSGSVVTTPGLVAVSENATASQPAAGETKATCFPDTLPIVHAMEYGPDGLLYIGGQFGASRADPGTLARFGSFAVSQSSGIAVVDALALDLERHRIYLAGSFTTAGSEPRPGLAAFSSLPDSSLDRAWSPPSDTPRVNRIFVRAGRVTMGGNMDVYSQNPPGPRSAIAFAFPLAGTSIMAHYYQQILGRAPDVSGRAFWPPEVHRQAYLGIDPREVYIAMAMFFFGSQEFNATPITDQQFVERLYLTFFNRPSDPSGMNFWMGQLQQGLTREMVMFAFMFSAEFQAYMDGILGVSNARAEIGVVVDFYRGALARLPDAAGLRNWVNQFRQAQCSPSDMLGAVRQTAWQISGAFFNSAEYFNANPSNETFVGDLYNAFLRRSADIGGFRSWVDALNSGALTRDDVRYQFLVSPEFTARVDAIGNAGCTGPMP